MSKIRQLSDEVCNKIAAGEVVERPASIVKELVENSLDAGALKITVTIEDGGRRSITVADDGEGMDADDALLCLDPHSTSKIATEADIFDIASFGFRGEAIPSIAAVTRLTIRTRRRETPEGVEVFIAGGKAVTESPPDVRPAPRSRHATSFSTSRRARTSCGPSRPRNATSSRSSRTSRWRTTTSRSS